MQVFGYSQHASHHQRFLRQVMVPWMWLEAYFPQRFLRQVMVPWMWLEAYFSDEVSLPREE